MQFDRGGGTFTWKDAVKRSRSTVWRNTYTGQTNSTVQHLQALGQSIWFKYLNINSGTTTWDYSSQHHLLTINFNTTKVWPLYPHKQLYGFYRRRRYRLITLQQASHITNSACDHNSGFYRDFPKHQFSSSVEDKPLGGLRQLTR